MTTKTTAERPQSTHSERQACCHKRMSTDKDKDKDSYRRGCGCLKTSEKLKEILSKFPAPPPPTPASQCPSPVGKVADPEPPKFLQTFRDYGQNPFTTTPQTGRNSACLHHAPKPPHPFVAQQCPVYTTTASYPEFDVKQYKPELVMKELDEKPKHETRVWRLVAELVQLLQLFVMATALMLYYIIYCYMQLVYFTLQTAIYFHNADGPMKVTIVIVTLSAIIVAFNLMLRIERLSWHGCKHDAYTN